MTKRATTLTIDCHTHAGGEDPLNKFRGIYPSSQNACDLARKQQSNGIEGGIVFPMPGTYYYKFTTEGTSWEPSGLMDYPYQFENMTLLKEVSVAKRLYPKNTLLPFMNIHPTEKVSAQISFLDQVLSSGKAFGLKLHTKAANASASELIDSPFATLMEKWNVPLIVHSGSDDLSDPQHVIDFIEAHPNGRVSIAHMANWDQEIIEKVRALPNAYIDCAPFLGILETKLRGLRVSSNPIQLPSSIPVEVLAFLSEELVDKLLWGTDEPWTTLDTGNPEIGFTYSYDDEAMVLRKLRNSGHEKEVKQISQNNPIKFLTGCSLVDESLGKLKCDSKQPILELLIKEIKSENL